MESLENTMERVEKEDTNKSSEVEILLKENDEKILLEAEQRWNIFEDESELPCLLPDYQHGVHEKYATADGVHFDIHETNRPDTWDDFENNI